MKGMWTVFGVLVVSVCLVGLWSCNVFETGDRVAPTAPGGGT